jgi:hypothetical protein
MTDSGHPPAPDQLVNLVTDEPTDAVLTALDRLSTADTDTRKQCLQALRKLAGERQRVFAGLTPKLADFLTDEDRAVRLTTAKIFVRVAQTEPALIRSTVEPLAARLADGEEFYYVRARSAEALGYVGLEYPEDVSDPEILADFRIGLSFDEPEVKEKLAKALAYVAVGDPGRLRHHVSSVADHLDDDNTLVRYHLTTALVAVGCDHPDRLSDVTAELTERLTDGSPYVRGRSIEALGMLARSETALDWDTALDGIETAFDDAPRFLTERLQFARRASTDEDQSIITEFGTIDSIQTSIEDGAEGIRSPDSDKECPHCGLDIPDSGPPMCPQCGAPR